MKLCVSILHDIGCILRKQQNRLQTSTDSSDVFQPSRASKTKASYFHVEQKIAKSTICWFASFGLRKRLPDVKLSKRRSLGWKSNEEITSSKFHQTIFQLLVPLSARCSSLEPDNEFPGLTSTCSVPEHLAEA